MAPTSNAYSPRRTDCTASPASFICACDPSCELAVVEHDKSSMERKKRMMRLAGESTFEALARRVLCGENEEHTPAVEGRCRYSELPVEIVESDISRLCGCITDPRVAIVETSTRPKTVFFTS